MRRGTFREGTVDYAAVGATHAPDLMQYPPERSIPAEASWRLGSGEERFRTAGESLLSWTAQRAAARTLISQRPTTLTEWKDYLPHMHMEDHAALCREFVAGGLVALR